MCYNHNSHNFFIQRGALIIAFIVLLALFLPFKSMVIAGASYGGSEYNESQDGIHERSAPANEQTAIRYSGEQNQILGQATIMTPMDCAQRYGMQFCECTTLDDGSRGCYYKKPEEEAYPNRGACVNVWGEGNCRCEQREGQTYCVKDSSTNRSSTMSCRGNIYIFGGEQMECREAGIKTMYKECCNKKNMSSGKCSFENTANLMGMDKGVIKAAEQLGDYMNVDNELGQQVTEQFGAYDTIYNSMVGTGNSFLRNGAKNMFEKSMDMNGMGQDYISDYISGSVANPDEVAQQAQGAFADELAKGNGRDAAESAMEESLKENGVSQAGDASHVAEQTGQKMSEEAGGQASMFSDAVNSAAMAGVTDIAFAAMDGKITGEELQSAGTSMAVAFASSYIPGIGWAYTAYKVYNMAMKMRQCNVGEQILACKRGLKKCHYVGDKCSIEVFGNCLQEKERYCCFSNQLARIVHEQGRPQLQEKGVDELGWGDAGDPNCRGFYPGELAQIDFTQLDLSEYFDDVSRHATTDMSQEQEMLEENLQQGASQF